MKMMEEVEKLCDRLELTRYESVLAKEPLSPRSRCRQRAAVAKERDAFGFLARL